MISRKGPWEGYIVSFPPSFARERETSGYEADTKYCARVSWRENVIAVVILRLVL